MANLYSQLDSHCIHGGHLYKKGVYNRAWKKRYFVLYDDRTISYFEKEKHAKSRNKAKGSIHLTQIQRVEFVQFVDPTVIHTKSQANEIFTNNSHQIDPSNKQNKLQNNYIQHTYLHHLRHQSAPSEENKSAIDLRSKLKHKTRPGSPSNSFTTDDLGILMHVPFSPKSIINKRKRLNTFNTDQNWCISPIDPLSPINNVHKRGNIGVTPFSPYVDIEEEDDIFSNTLNTIAKHRRRSSTIGDVPRSQSAAKASLDKIIGKKSHHRPQSATLSNGVTTLTSWNSLVDEEEEEEEDIDGKRHKKKKSTLCLPRPPPRKSVETHSLPIANDLENKQKHNKDIIVCDNIRKYKRELNEMEIMSRDTELNLYSQVLESTTSDLSADRQYSFALIQADRTWILSAETERECNNWLQCLQLLVQGRKTYCGWLIKRGKNVKSWKKRYFQLFENKVLNYYHNEKQGALIGDIDLRHAMWLRVCAKNEFRVNVSDFFGKTKSKSSHNLNKRSASIKIGRNKKKGKHHKSNSWGKKGAQKKKKKADAVDDSYLFEIATPNRTWLFCAERELIRNMWYAQIRDVFSDKLLLKIYFDSPCNLHIIHMGQNLQNRYAALLKGWLIIFRDKDKLNNIRSMTFFSDTIFRDYVRNKNCICIPLQNAHMHISEGSIYGEWSFELKIQDRCWYFNIETEEILNKWIALLTHKHVDYSHVEQSYSNLPLPENRNRSQALKEVDPDINQGHLSPISGKLSPI